MNTQASSISPRQRFVWLLRREYWEHKGGFFWAPIWTGVIALALTLMGFIFAEIMAGRALESGKTALGEQSFRVNGIDLASITVKMTPDAIAEVSRSVTWASASAMFWPMLTMGIVVFFYCLSSLYDERRDRSVLFWKSLPLSDRDTVLSKVVSALVVAPVIATVAGVACMLGFMLIVAVFVLLHGGNPFILLWSPGAFLTTISLALAALPIYVLWALPSVGWLMLCSAWAKSKPFLWALMLPAFAGVFLTWFDWLSSVDMGSNWFWKHVVARILGGVFPGTWLRSMDMQSLGSLVSFDYGGSLLAMYSVLGHVEIWIGTVAGIAMIVLAIRLRRNRDDS